MLRVKTLQTLFRRHRRPGDIVFAWIVLIFAVFLLSQISTQTTDRAGSALFAQPWFWPFVSLTGMVGFAAFHLLGSALSERIDGRWREVLLWVSSVEYAAWFIAYALVVPIVGYLPTTAFFAVALSFRVGYRHRSMLLWAALSAFVIVVLFKSLLQVRLPGGQLYQHLPDGIRQFMLTYF